MYMDRPVSFQLGDARFAWDPDKNRANAEKHGAAFEEAATTWLDHRALETYDDEHSGREDRYFRLGFSLRNALLVTWFCMRSQEGGEVVRIIGARRATKREQQVYEQEAR